MYLNEWFGRFVLLFLYGGLVSAQTSPGETQGVEKPTLAPERVVLVPAAASDSDKTLDLKRAGLEKPISPTVSRSDAVQPIRYLWGDVDNDGLKDLFLLSGEGNLIFRNRGDGDFEDVTSRAFPWGAGVGGGGLFVDYNEDGLLDLFLFREEEVALCRNDGSFYFSTVTAEAGLPTGMTCDNVSLEDYDNDGFKDFLFRTPEGDRLFHNEGGLVFFEKCFSSTRLH